MECILNKVDPQFESTQGLNYRLSVLLCRDGFSFLVTHATSQKVLRISSYKIVHPGIQKAEMGGWHENGAAYFEVLKKVDLTQLLFNRVVIAITSDKITVAPHDFMEQGNAIKMISAAYPVREDEKILTEPIFDLGPVTALLIPGYIPEYCSTIFPDSLLRSAPAIFVKGILRKHSSLISRQVFININSEYFEIAVIQGLRLLYLNVFRYSAPSDVLYYVIFVLEQLGFVPEQENVILMGDITESSVIFSQLKMYCGALKFATSPDDLEYGVAFSGIAMHTYFTLLNIPICE